MTERVSGMPVAVINPWMPGSTVRYVLVSDHNDAAKIRVSGWEILRGVEMYVDKNGLIQVDDR